jgi:hypothetical protein
MGQMMHHLIKSKRVPEALPMHIAIAPEVAGTGLDAIHDEMNDKIKYGQPPKLSAEGEANGESDQSVNEAMHAQGQNKIPTRTEFFKHVLPLQGKIRHEMLDLKERKQNKNCF